MTKEIVEKIYGIFTKQKIWKDDTYKEMIFLTEDGAEKLLDKINEIIDYLNAKRKRNPKRNRKPNKNRL